jgi:predicted component of type VI protein secretion system
VTAGFVNPTDILKGTVGLVHALHHFADLLDHALVGFVLRINRQHSLARGVRDHLTKGYFAQIAALPKQPGDERTEGTPHPGH